MYFNKKGSILADFYIYWPLMRERVVNEHPVDYERDKVEVNPNYLKVNPIYDVEGEKINIDESETDYILLVPEQYMTYETKIVEYYNNLANGYDRKPETTDQGIKILWIKEDQKLFTYRIDINPINGNRVKNAIIRVITESNGKIRDYDRIIAYSGNPFKIKVDDPLNPSASIRSKLREYGLSQYIADIPSVYDYVASEVKTITDRLLFLSVILLLTCGIIVLIIVHNIYNYFYL